MATIKIDDKDYNIDSFSQEAKAQLASLQFCELELQRLQVETAAYQTAKIAYVRALKEAIENSGKETVKFPSLTANSEGSRTTNTQDNTSPSQAPGPTEKKSFFKGLFSKK